jgi:hypothetical protein
MASAHEQAREAADLLIIKQEGEISGHRFINPSPQDAADAASYVWAYRVQGAVSAMRLAADRYELENQSKAEGLELAVQILLEKME